MLSCQVSAQCFNREIALQGHVTVRLVEYRVKFQIVRVESAATVVIDQAALFQDRSNVVNIKYIGTEAAPDSCPE